MGVTEKGQTNEGDGGYDYRRTQEMEGMIIAEPRRWRV